MSHSAAILIVGPSWVGDMVMAQPLLMLLQERHPQLALDVLAPPWSLPLLQRMPQVRRALPLAVAHGQLALAQRWQLGRSLRQQYQQAILLPNSLKSALLPFAAQIPRRTGFLGEWRFGLLNDIRPLDKKRLPRTVDRFLALGINPQEPLPPTPLPQLRSSPEQAALTLRHWFPHGVTRPLLALCPGAEYGAAKRWPVARFAELAALAQQRGWQVLLLGSAKEHALGQQISQLSGHACHNLLGQTSLEQAVDLLSLAGCVVSNDSGLMHVAAALHRPVVALFGSSDPHHTPPLGQQTRILSLGLPCAPCFRRNCPHADLPCLSAISARYVLEQVEKPWPPL
ncbi:lipopolysaccharide heptosyltransferase II [Candidatus Magnetaquicoccus inordinatus]|uniref:lipopolysaccharide heptosyltransferase II n=1 Tax=Candidatus Magnetaquicoccus inordinatus TaxID=2496818 RepID=UPI00102B212B|nr:lipopolysaccharide heptosyltransferase II [Candidatus Magnetaquicoccus inordinatus]